MAQYDNYCDIGNIQEKIKQYFIENSFLMKEQIFDIDLPESKMRKLKHLNEYTIGSDDYIRLSTKISRLKQFKKEEMYLGKVDKSEKTAICLHFTAGNFGGADSTTCNTKPNRAIEKHNAVNYWVYRDGTIVEYMEPEYWAHHSHGGDTYNPKIIAIEIVNYGWLELKNDGYLHSCSGIYCSKDEQCKGKDLAYIDLANNDYDKLGRYPHSEYRGYRYYAAFTTLQTQSVAKLLKTLCKEYDIPYRFLPYDIRFDHFEWNEPMRQLVTDWSSFMNDNKEKAGIFSHVNTRYRNEDTNAVVKWDISPAFDWEYLENYNGFTTSFPLENNTNKLYQMTPIQWLNAAERGDQKGYFPIGSNLTAHTIVHIASPSTQSTPVRAMPNGSVTDLEIVQGKTKVTTGITNKIIIKMSSYNESE
ncbi:peptidoglycan recognition protein family protein [Spirochaeta cellobiosiphila]|uniref:peptidoglycan recognition protein family protein n=1 Tax=Spirochaeta cellobiosiphila TaxID=504483 RepID=UPI0003F591E3|nr:N-acetylmuramoyl-L-alanine amidase [Spirochaeta cellobiosiphila]